jgi:hypothetical protein
VRSLAIPAPGWLLPTKVSQMLAANWYLSTSTLHPGIGASVAETHRIDRPTTPREKQAD